MPTKTKGKTKKKECPEGQKRVRIKPPKDGRTLPPGMRYKCVPIKKPKSEHETGAIIKEPGKEPDLPSEKQTK